MKHDTQCHVASWSTTHSVMPHHEARYTVSCCIMKHDTQCHVASWSTTHSVMLHHEARHTVSCCNVIRYTTSRRCRETASAKCCKLPGRLVSSVMQHLITAHSFIVSLCTLPRVWHPHHKEHYDSCYQHKRSTCIGVVAPFPSQTGAIYNSLLWHITASMLERQTYVDRHKQTERIRQTDRQTDRQRGSDRQTDRQRGSDRQTDRQTGVANRHCACWTTSIWMPRWCWCMQKKVQLSLVAAWVVRPKAATVCDFWITQSCLIWKQITHCLFYNTLLQMGLSFMCPIIVQPNDSVYFNTPRKHLWCSSPCGLFPVNVWQ